MSNSILIVEDEIKLAELLADYFKLTEYEPHLIHHGDEVITWVKEHQPSVILLDIMLPGKNGIDICKEIRQFSNIPILLVTAKVDPREVVARVKAVLRRTQTIHYNTEILKLDEHRFTVEFHNQEVALTSVEFQLLKPLANKPERIFTREQLMQNMYSDQRIVNNRTIDSHIKKLRKKLADISEGKDWIQSVYGTGYRLML